MSDGDDAGVGHYAFEAIRWTAVAVLFGMSIIFAIGFVWNPYDASGWGRAFYLVIAAGGLASIPLYTGGVSGDE